MPTTLFQESFTGFTGAGFSAVGGYGHTDWQRFTQNLGAGDCTLEAGVRNGVDVGGDSELLLDHVSVGGGSGAVP